MVDLSAAAAVPQAREQERLIYLDGWRGCAVALVLIGHFTPIPGIRLGPLGVELFFVLSGRLMAEILFIQKTPLKTFFPRRINRVYPALLVFVLVTAAVSQFSDMRVGPKAVATSLLFISNYNLWVPGLYQHAFVDHLWSLCVEEHSYVVLALVVLAGRAFGVRPLPTLIMITVLGFINGILSMSVFGLNYYETYWRTDVHIASITAGAAIHLWLSRGSIDAPGWLAPLMLFLGICFNFSIFHTTVNYTIGTLCLAVSVCTLGQSVQWFCRMFDNRVAVVLGIYSYSLYLWQQPFYKMHRADDLSLVAGLAITFALAALSFHFVERPARSYLNKKFSTPRRASLSDLKPEPQPQL